MEFSLGLAFLIGLSSSLHCVGMCGAISGALSMGLPESVRSRRSRLLGYNLLFSLGRVASYGVAGLLSGLLGAALIDPMQPGPSLGWLRLLASVVVVLLGLYLGGWWPRLAWVESLGAPVWKHLEPLGRRLIPIRSPLQALVYGLVWGWLPCGLVYWALLIAATAANPTESATFMLVFGLATLPTLLATGLLAGWIRQLRNLGYARQAAGALLVLMGLLALWYTEALDMLLQGPR